MVAEACVRMRGGAFALVLGCCLLAEVVKASPTTTLSAASPKIDKLLYSKRLEQLEKFDGKVVKWPTLKFIFLNCVAAVDPG